MEGRVVIVDYGVHFDTILYPFTIPELANTLERIGYELSPLLPFPRLPGRPSGAGEIARKGKTAVHIDAGAQVLIVVDVSIESVLKSFDEIANAFLEDNRVDIDNIVRFYRFNSTYEVRTEKDPLQSIASNLEVPALEKFSEIFDEEVWPLELRFTGARLKANSENWYDISIRPDYEKNDKYVFSVVYRNKDKEKTQNFINRFEERLLKIAELIEG